MRRSDWYRLPVNVRGDRRRHLLKQIAREGARSYRLIDSLNSDLPGGSRRDPQIDYGKIQELLESMNEFLNLYDMLVYNVLRAQDLNDDDYLDNHATDYLTAEDRIEFEVDEGKKSHADTSVIMPAFFAEVQKVQNYFYRMLEQTKQIMADRDMSFDAALAITIKQMGGRLPEKEAEIETSNYTEPYPEEQLMEEAPDTTELDDLPDDEERAEQAQEHDTGDDMWDEIEQQEVNA